ncbi:MAG: phenylacetate-CoA oxygenase subunit PaaJ [Streptomyces sp.]|nr:phenylacetate-CoA oxygenase subunit PaaJ [Streptomyces sp.]
MSGDRPLSPAELLAAVEALPDPDLPMVTLGDLGMVRAVRPGADGAPEVEITPTFVGCPAVDAIERAVRDVLAAGGHPGGRVRRVLVPAWTSDRVTEDGRRKLAEHGIALPAGGAGPVPAALCPRCGGARTRPLSPFGPARCQAIMQCTACREPFALMRGCEAAS